MVEKILLCFLSFASMLYLFFAQQLSFGSLKSPKSGFLPILAGIAGVVISLILLFHHLRSKEIVVESNADWTKFLSLIIGLIFYITFFNILGYFASTFIFLFYLFKIGDTTGWLVPFLMAAGSAISFFLIFKYYLAVTLP